MKMFQVRLNEPLAKMLEWVSDTSDISQSEIVRRVLTKYFEEEEPGLWPRVMKEFRGKQSSDHLLAAPTPKQEGQRWVNKALK